MIKCLSLAANIVRSCNNSCVACSQAAPINDKNDMHAHELKMYLDELKGIIHTDIFYLVGGEPFTHYDIKSMLEISVGSGIGDIYCIITNGRLLSNMSDEIWKSLSNEKVFLRLSMYPNLSGIEYSDISEKSNRYGVAIQVNEYREFLPPLKINRDFTCFASCKWRGCNIIQDGYFYLCQSAPWMNEMLDINPGIDGVRIDGINENELTAYIMRSEHLVSCGMCTGGNAKAIPWKQCASKDWVPMSTVEL